MTEQTLKDNHTAGRRRRHDQLIVTCLHAAQFLAGAIGYAAAAVLLREGPAHATTPITWAIVATAATGGICAIIAKSRLLYPVPLYHWLSKYSLSLCALHTGTLLLTTRALRDSPETAPISALGFAGVSLIFACRAAKLLSKQIARPRSSPSQCATETLCLRHASDAPDGTTLYVPTSALFFTGGGTLMIDGTTTASSHPSAEHTLRLIREGVGFAAVSQHNEPVNVPRQLRDAEVPEHIFIVTNQ